MSALSAIEATLRKEFRFYRNAERPGRPGKKRNKGIAERYVSDPDMPSLRQLGNEYGITGERVRQIVERFYPGYKRPKKYRLTKDEKLSARLVTRTRIFWSTVNKSHGLGPNGDCWEWTGVRNPVSQYGVFGFSSLMGGSGMGKRYTHRIAWTLINGSIPDGLQILHHCDNPPCVNPAHLWLGTAKDNMADRDAKGRNGTKTHPEVAKANGRKLAEWWTKHPEKIRAGNRHPRYVAKLKESDIPAIRQLRDDGMSVVSLAKLYNVSLSAIYAILEKRTWSHIP